MEEIIAFSIFGLIILAIIWAVGAFVASWLSIVLAVITIPFWWHFYFMIVDGEEWNLMAMHLFLNLNQKTLISIVKNIIKKISFRSWKVKKWGMIVITKLKNLLKRNPKKWFVIYLSSVGAIEREFDSFLPLETIYMNVGKEEKSIFYQYYKNSEKQIAVYVEQVDN